MSAQGGHGSTCVPLPRLSDFALIVGFPRLQSATIIALNRPVASAGVERASTCLKTLPGNQRLGRACSTAMNRSIFATLPLQPEMIGQRAVCSCTPEDLRRHRTGDSAALAASLASTEIAASMSQVGSIVLRRCAADTDEAITQVTVQPRAEFASRQHWQALQTDYVLDYYARGIAAFCRRFRPMLHPGRGTGAHTAPRCSAADAASPGAAALPLEDLRRYCR